MTNQIPKTIEALNILSSQWKQTTSGTVKHDTIVQQYKHLLNQLENTSWDGFLGEDNELPDEFLPESYLQRRTEALERLDYELGDLACDYRRKYVAGEDRTPIIKEYEEVLRKMFFIGHWNRDPDFDCHLADVDMPQFYHDYWKAFREQMEKKGLM